MSQDDAGTTDPFGKASLDASAAEARAAAQAAKNKVGRSDETPRGFQRMPDHPGSTGDPAPAAADTVTKAPPKVGDAKAAAGDIAQDRPEILIGAAFAGAFLLAKLLKRMAG